MSEFSKGKSIDSETAFALWVPYTLRKRDVTISSIKYYRRKITHKYGTVIPVNAEHAFDIDENNHNQFLKDALKKEMHNVEIALKFLENDTPPQF